MVKKFSEIKPGKLFVRRGRVYVKVFRPTMLVPLTPTRVIPGYADCPVNAVRLGDGECYNFEPHETFEVITCG